MNGDCFHTFPDLVKVVKEVKDIADTVIKIRKIENMVVAAFTDSSLYGSEGELILDDEAPVDMTNTNCTHKQEVCL